MSVLNPKVDLYLLDGCGRCKYHATPKCKVNTWRTELATLRQIVLECDLTEELKWGVPVYTWHGKNIVNVSAFKDYACLSFFKGALLNDTKKLLQKHGESSQSARTINFTNAQDITKCASTLKQYIQEAIIIERNGEKVVFKKNLEPVPEELENIFKHNQTLKNAFYALTPGRQRGYIIHFSQPKQSETRISRIEKCEQKILNGEGFNDKYKSKDFS